MKKLVTVMSSLVCNPSISSPCSCSKREKTFSGIPAHFIQSRQSSPQRGVTCLLVNMQREGSCCLLCVWRLPLCTHLVKDRKLAKTTTTLRATWIKNWDSFHPSTFPPSASSSRSSSSIHQSCASSVHQHPQSALSSQPSAGKANPSSWCLL